MLYKIYNYCYNAYKIKNKEEENMSKKLIAIIGVPVGIVLISIMMLTGSYNGLVSKDESVKQANSKIEVALQRRADLIPNVVNSVKGYMKHEEDIFTKIADARSKIGSGNKETKNEGESELTSAISRLLVVQENYPELKADAQVSSLMSELEGTENRLFVARKDYNDTATEYNKAIRRFPTNIMANLFGFQRAELIEADKEAKVAPKVNLTD